MQIMVVDFETGGLDPQYSPILSAGWVLLDDELMEVRHGETLVQPFEGSTCSEQALKINKLDPALCNSMGINEEQLLDIFDHQLGEYDRMEDVPADMVRKTLWAGQNPKFDWAFYCAMLERAGRPLPTRWDYHLLDTFSMGMQTFFSGSVGTTAKNCKLEPLVAKHGGLLRTAHQSLADAMASAEVIQKSLRGEWRIKFDPVRNINNGETEILKEHGGRQVPRHS